MADHSIRGKVVLIAGGAKNLGGLDVPPSSVALGFRVRGLM
ncbi:short-chain dehydrogenase [Pandoraea commovens]|uniref:Short-chain dehydrogenase n=1 Tax=Pandoraea commovens TaxID=2508289 RepID=A0A5E4XUB6_9BURK|nr:short-chain dehydrogenase [Pandoraea commovens]